MFYVNPKSKGISIFLAIVIMTIILAIALGVSTILIGQIRMIKGMGDSVKSFFAADTGAERVLYEDKMCRQENCDSLPWSCVDPVGCAAGRQAGTISDSVGSAGYEVNFNNGATIISSKGKYGGSQRAIEVRR